MEAVWRESLEQANEMLLSITASDLSQGTSTPASGVTNATIQGVRTIAINVIGAVAYGTKVSWAQRPEPAPSGCRTSYLESILTVVENLAPSAMIPAWLLSSPIFPANITRVGDAVTDFPKHVRRLLEEERRSSSTSARVNLMSTMIKMSDYSNFGADGSSKTKLFLSDNEIAGNLFQFTVAGEYCAMTFDRP